MFKRRKIKSLRTVNGTYHRVCPKGEFWKGEGYSKWAYIPECSVKHLGRQIYLVGYFNDYKSGEYYSTFGGQQEINQYVILFPSEIAEVMYD